MLTTFSSVILLFLLTLQILGSDVTDVTDNPQDREKLNIQQKGRLSLQNTAEIQNCLVNTGDVGCGVFECFENNSCEIRGLNEICMTFLHNAGKFDAQGKSFIKDALKCMAHGLRHKFSCISRKCPAIKEMVFQLQRECYLKHNLCAAAKDNVNVMVEMIRFQDLFPRGPYVELVNILLGCGEEVKEAIIQSVRVQCEQNWGSLCDSLSFCTLNKPGDQSLSATVIPEKKQGNNKAIDTVQQNHELEQEHGEISKSEKAPKVHVNPHPRARPNSQSLSIKMEEDAEQSDIRR
ncbi:stanniocalcin-2 [Erpetoichthys calabaricus]|uniref:Stanniocalcin n=1 Tax=Erpetoichthys calabaricus TaxID=27687 RepID=A0A8C4SNI1_ERPCA|nr:stanniocalcin-2 [Erpetoichthys calabaricus]